MTNHVEVETPAGDVRIGEVVERELVAEYNVPAHWILVVEINGRRLRVPQDEAAPV